MGGKGLKMLPPPSLRIITGYREIVGGNLKKIMGVEWNMQYAAL